MRRAERERFAALATGLGLPFLLLDCQADAATLRRRVRERQERRDDASEADEAVLEQQLAFDEPPAGAEIAHLLCVRTDGPADAAAVVAAWHAVRAPASANVVPPTGIEPVSGA